MLTENQRLITYFALIPLILLACVPAQVEPLPASETISPSGDTPIPLVDLSANQTYLGYTGGLYPGSSSQMPDQHHRAGLESAASIQPRDVDGNPHPQGKIILLSIGMSNASQEFCHAGPEPPQGCYPYSFMGKAAQDESVNHANLVLINGAFAGALTHQWTSPDDEYGHYARIESQLANQGLSPLQVQAVWVKLANGSPQVSLPHPNADALRFLADLGEVVRTLKTLYPNLQQAYLSSRIYGGYADPDHSLNPEPYAYEYGYAVKWLLEAQIEQMDSGQVDPQSGSLDYNAGTAPWLSWGAYLWADGMNPRQLDGLIWEINDFAGDQTHPSPAGREKVADLLMQFFKTSAHTCSWFLADAPCPDPDEGNHLFTRLHLPILILRSG
ncbi:MAG: hypothetical protein IBX69_18410 [Anaerolineales bacterium]|nr:hypothetical protein [Anaerolineales bacterium]